MLNVEAILEQFNIMHSRPNSRGWVELPCPYCGKPHLGWSVKSGVFNCFHCGAHPLIQTAASVLGISEQAVKDLLDKQKGRRRVEQSYSETEFEQARVCTLPEGTRPLRKSHRRYLEGRGFDVDSLLALWLPQSTPKGNDTLANRIVMPMVLKSIMVSWQARSTLKNIDPKLRYRTCDRKHEVVFHKHAVYGWDYIAPIKMAVIVEGPMDVWKLGPGAGHLFGTAFRPEQMLMLSKLDVVYTLFDSEPMAQMQARRLAKLISTLSGTKVMNVSEIGYKDPGEMPLAEAKKLMRELGFPY